MEVLYRKYRPQNLSQVFGQPQIVSYFEKTLKDSKVSHAYLFSGPRGLGKTTVARILAKTLNCESGDPPCGKCPSCRSMLLGNHLDIIEIDAASNRGIDDVRSLRGMVGLLPQMGKYKIYILDEAHMLTNDAWNAFLKTLEEPPPHVVFILCTTESYKLPETILSRVLRFDFAVPNEILLTNFLSGIIKKEGLSFTDEAIKLLAQKSGASFRDGLSLLEKAADQQNPHKTIDKDRLEEVLGFPSFEKVQTLLTFLAQKDGFSAIDFIDNSKEMDLSELLKEVLLALRQELLGRVKPLFIPDDALRLTKLLMNAQKEIKYSDLPQLPLEIAILEFCQFSNQRLPNLPNRPNLTNSLEIKKSAADLPADSVDLVAIWPKVLEQVKPLNHSMELSLRACRPLSLQNGILELCFDFPFHKEQIGKESNRSLIEKVISGIAGAPIKIKTILGERNKQAVFQDRAEGIPSREEKTENLRPASNGSSDLLIKAARDLGGTLIQ